MSDKRIFVDPREFGRDDLPIIVLVDDLRGFIGWSIKAHQSGNYNHSMIMHKIGKIASQDFAGFREKPIEDYLKSNFMLKFWRIKDLTSLEAIIIVANVSKRLSLPWYRRQYDWIGIFGQFIRLNFIQNPFSAYCSEQVRDDYIKSVEKADRVVPRKPSPSTLDMTFKLYPNIFECKGYWWNG